MTTRPIVEAPRYWRIASSSKKNIELGVRAEQWGVHKVRGFQAMAPGDGLVFYVSTGRDAGYWGAARVTSTVFVSSQVIWSDGLYPARFSLVADGPVRSTPVPKEVVMVRLGKRSLTFQRHAAVMPLTADEYAAIVDLLRSRP